MKPELSVVIPALNEARNLGKLLPELHNALETIQHKKNYEIIVVDGGSKDNTREICAESDAEVITQNAPGYGNALVEGFKRAAGEYTLTMDSDLSHAPQFVRGMWDARHRADIVIASRYIKGGCAVMPFYRKVLSRLLNLIFSRAFSLPYKDVSSGFRLYRAAVIRKLSLQSRDFEILEEILVRCHRDGRSILEVPFRYIPRREGKSHVRLLRFGMGFARAFFRLQKLRVRPVTR